MIVRFPKILTYAILDKITLNFWNIKHNFTLFDRFVPKALRVMMKCQGVEEILLLSLVLS